MVVLLVGLSWKDLCIHSPMSLMRKSCSNLLAETPLPNNFADFLKTATANFSKSAGRDIYTKDLLPARVTILFKLVSVWRCNLFGFESNVYFFLRSNEIKGFFDHPGYEQYVWK